MNENRMKIQRLTLAAFFVGIQILMGWTPIGYLPLGTVSITTMHLPVILAGILGGAKFGASMGFVFGLTSLLRATFTPDASAFMFSPFITIGGVSGNFWSLVICFVPRILLGFLSAVIYDICYKKVKNDLFSAACSAVINTVLHTIGVLGGIFVFFGPQYAMLLGANLKAVAIALLGVMSANMIPEAILAGSAVPVLVKALRPISRHLGMKGENHDGPETDSGN